MNFVIKNHYLMLIISLFIGFIVVLPNILFKASSVYKGIPMMYTDAEYLYLSRINAAYDGCVWNCNPFTKTERGLPSPDPSISTLVLATPGILLKIPAPYLKVFYEFALPFILSLLVYFLIYRLTKNKILSILGTLLIIFGIKFLDQFEYVIYTRLVNPTFSSILFFIYLHVLLSFLEKKSIKSLVLLSMLYALTFYVYLYVCIFITAINTAVWLAFLSQKNWRNLKSFTIIMSLGGLIGLPVVIQFYKLANHPWFKNIYSPGIKTGHLPSISALGISLFLTFLVLLFLYKTKYKVIPVEIYFISILILSCFIARNQHVITGKTVQYFHFDFYYIKPIFIIFLCYTLNLFLKKNKFNNFILGLLCMIPLLNGLTVQLQTYHDKLNQFTKLQKIEPVLSFLNNNIPTHTILIDFDLDLQNLVPVYTHDYSIWSYYTNDFYLHPEETENIRKIFYSSELFKAISHANNSQYLILTKLEKQYLVFNIEEVTRGVVYDDDNYIIYKI